MREYKFRAWDESEKEMIEDFQFFKSGDGNADWIIPKHKVWEDIQGDNNTVEMNKYPHMRQQFILMQWTGLTDRKCLEDLYEGDIIDIKGAKVGNVYESPKLLENTTNFVITGMGTKEWRNTEQETIKRGCFYAK